MSAAAMLPLDKFFEWVRFAQAQPNLYKHTYALLQFVSDTPWYEMDGPLRDYFGCANDQASAWIEYARKRSLRDTSHEELKRLWDDAVDLTFAGRWPALLEAYRSEWEEDDDD